MGRFLPHPDDVPVEITPRKQPALSRQKLHSISLGGVACNSDRGWRRGAAVDMHMPSLGETAHYPGYIAWCEKQPQGYRVGVAFTDDQILFGARMGEQVCQIEHYYRLQHEQNQLPENMEALALEWVNRHAVEFSQATLDHALAQPALD
ncbi:PilZ domain-containing protein [Pseudomonas sp. CCC3.1]|uniref:PilZ domain-containing protein n=1 Tax=Pseudomonas sp. CCC3.1 TaxID=3048607 RepID=UPI002AC9AB37|nr:PilZ domain-containing protein [Pseudomonas sp. CCC3.1]MEB0207016.1 PilZ domain-containing protein [Pseudomonas sp. CCC3.1]WPX37621.1 PilZ domain-containing protein [Pseudomonas sp. CCC3.1]